VEYMIPEMIDFLNIKGDIAQKLQQTHNKLTDSILSNDINRSFRVSSSFNYLERMTRYEDLDSEFVELNTIIDV